LTALELHRRGLAQSNSGLYAAARVTFHRALERAADAETEARILLSLGHVESELGSTPEGLALCRRALAMDGVPTDVRGLAHSQIAFLQMRSGNGVEAMREFALAEELVGDDPEARARIHLNRGYLYLQRADAAHASSDLQLAVRFAASAGMADDVAKAQHNLGYARLLAGDLTGALTILDAVRPTLEAQSAIHAAVCDQDRAEALIAAGLTRDAVTALRNAIRAFGTRGARQHQGEAELTLARLLLMTDPAESRVVARRASRRFRARGSEVWALRAEAVAIAADVATGRTPSTVLERADELAADLRGHRLQWDSGSVALTGAMAAVRRRDIDGATRRLRQVRVTDAAPLTIRLLDREVRAEVSRARGRRSDAFRHVRRGLDELHAWQASFGGLDLQSSVVGHGRRLAVQGARLALEDGRPAVVFEWSERARALASRVTPVRPPTDEAAAAALAELRQLHNALADSEGSTPATLARRERRLREQIRQRAWYDVGSGEVSEPARLDELQAALARDDAALLATLMVDDRLHALVVTGSSADVVSLGGFGPVRQLLEGLHADLDVSASHLPAAMRDVVLAGLRQRLAHLDTLLVAPLRDRIDGRRVVVVPSGFLAGVPWTLLPGLAGRPVTLPRSASTWVVQRDRRTPSRRAGFVAGPRVDRADEEVRKASATWSAARVLTGDEAVARAVSDLAAEVDVLHAAAHGRHSADNPLFSGLELVDGPWFGYDIDQLRAVPSTVVLSACELGRSTVRWGEETVGMTVAWLHAGARCVVASPAAVDDDVACEVLTATHQRLAAGEPPADALADATAGQVHPAPSPFLCFGSGW
jgi:tetratricopeptide (TPR) repeat protein